MSGDCQIEDFLFRPEYSGDRKDGFNRDKQIEICAHQLEVLREKHKDLWGMLKSYEAVHEEGSNPLKNKNDWPHIREFKNYVKHLIRISGESSDHYATVDFITRGVCSKLKEKMNANGGRSLKGDLSDSGNFAHEHMVPIQVALKHILDQDKPLKIYLEAVSYRALILKIKEDDLGDEVRKLDGKGNPLRNNLPAGVMNSVLPKFWGLARYEGAGLLGDLVPVSKRARTLLDEYRQLSERSVP